ncbi:MAG: DUF47 domain-containing protein [Planctomycetes bacterium]|nr:DUF47 domain-containing protein [Planctomycetota bacterium]
MFSLIPREQAFFELFEKAAANVHSGAVELNNLLNDFSDVNSKAAQIKEIEHIGDQLTHDTILKMNQTFITPFDREDIHELICRLDDILDLIDTAVARMVLYKIDKPTEQARQLGSVLVQATAVVEKAIKSLRNMNKTDGILSLCVQIHTHENEGDRIEQHALASLFTSGMNTVDIIKWKDIYQELEAATDRCEDVANVIEGIVLKNA